MDGIGSGVTVGEDKSPILINFAPVLPIRGKAIHRIEGGGRIGVHVPRTAAELPGQIHAYKGAAVLIISGKYNVIIVYIALFHSGAEAAVLGGFSAAVNALQHYQFTFAHFISLAGHTLLKTSPIFS